MSINNKTSLVVSSQLPFFVRNDHQTFATFLEAYYEYLEQSNTTISLGKTTERSKNLLQYMDVDSTLDVFAEHLYKKFLNAFPVNTLANRDTILKHAKDFYRAKGTEKSYKFLMRTLFNKEIELYYPKNDVLKASDGKWYIQKSLRVSDTQIENSANNDLTGLEKFINHRITGNTSGATATVESIDRFYEAGTQVDELVISTIVGTFREGERVETCFTDDGTGELCNISSEVFGSVINGITVLTAGSGYEIGDPVLIISNVGSEAVASVSRVSVGNLASIAILTGGAGYQANDYLLITGGGGSGANAKISQVTADSSVHPNSYNIFMSTINLEANTAINNTKYSNLNASITDPANNWIQNSMSTFVYANTGPASLITVIAAGSGYTSLPTLGVIANTRIQELGILGRMNIRNGGTGYVVSNKIEFINVPGGAGTGAMANVVNVSGSGAIQAVKFEAINGHLAGGSGYENAYLPRANVVTTTGSGANITVECILGTNATFSTSNTTLGAIERITVTNRGTGYRFTPTIDLTGSGDGTATAEASVIRGLYTYPGRYLNDDGQLSSYNFLQDRDYYQNYSYVIRVRESINNYRRLLKDLVHPAGMKMFGEYTYVNETEMIEAPAVSPESSQIIFLPKTYVKTQNVINVAYTTHGIPLTTGNNLVTNGGFDSDTAWTKGTGWNISGGKATSRQPGSYSNLFQSVGSNSNSKYQVTFTLSNVFTSYVLIYSGGNGGAGQYSANGTYTISVTPIGPNEDILFLQAHPYFNGSVDNVSVYVVPNSLPNVYLEFTSGGYSNVQNSFYRVLSNSTANHIIVRENTTGFANSNTSGNVSVGIRRV